MPTGHRPSPSNRLRVPSVAPPRRACAGWGDQLRPAPPSPASAPRRTIRGMDNPSPPNPPLFAPWRMEYIRSLSKSAKPGGEEPCFFCAAASAVTDDERRDRLVLWQTDHAVVLINRFP